MPRIIGLIGAEKPDSIGVQECDFNKVSGNMKAELEYGIAPFGCLCAQQEKWDGTAYAFKNFIWYNSGTTRCADSGQRWLSETPEAPSKGFGAKHYISMGWAVLENKASGVWYLHFNTHLYAMGAYTETPEERASIRLKEAKALLSHINELSTSYQIPTVFLTGDMNEAEGGEVYKTLTSELSDTRYLAKETTDRITFHCFGARSSVIDFCFCSIDKGIVNIHRFDIAEGYGGEVISDHNAVLVDVSINK